MKRVLDVENVELIHTGTKDEVSIKLKVSELPDLDIVFSREVWEKLFGMVENLSAKKDSTVLEKSN